ncbi:MAG: 1,4-dihydroxy-2-naphthoate polyprenyltransferase [Actinobacteria bacterium]|nr:1,4-dihydroxy-2-naphthoate polyprenyltransferase [Actinomycetota bacterium]
MTLDTWIKGARPRTLPAAVAPVVLATALAGSKFKPLEALLALAVSLLLQIGVNYANDYSDGIRGTDSDRVGPLRLVGSGLATPTSVKRAAFGCFALACLVGFFLAARTSWWIIAVGVAAIGAAWYYTGGSSPYGYKGLGEISVFVFFGIVATMGSYYVQTGQLTRQSFLLSIPMGSLACSLLAINNLRDRAKDELVGKRTLAVRLGDKASRYFFVLLLLSAHGAAILVTPWALLTLLLLPLTIRLIIPVMRGASGRDLIPLLGKTGQFQILFAALLATILWLS